ncbi:hypothetical protein QWY87_11815 [Lutimonas halocynthiae]|uniref:hypothetical protein n=1 Tax=Lutimonas halocynthiae TaxID=1446477 RepID=UPI0025B5B22D|nr:hypothetical protein [Lutimonas halocynthiae]MDN3643391.1 hypothetical protein [Lutimonas halocynthiae]
MDFTVKKYTELLDTLIEQNYSFQTFDAYLKKANDKVVMLRHDVDDLPGHSLRFAKIQHERGVKGVYYFRAVPQSWDVAIIKEIASLGHEVGYHYETMDTAGGNIDMAWDQFKQHLEDLRKLVPVSTICMHGSPRSKFDNKEIWKKYDYKTLNLIGEPYYDIDFDKVLYFTDTGRRWDGFKVSVRDKVKSNYDYTFHATDDIISALKKSTLPNQFMFNFHPQRWHDNNIQWTKELIIQNAKNVVKRVFFVSK